MITPNINENRTDFIKRGLKDDSIIDTFKDIASRTKYLRDIYNIYMKNQPLPGPKGEKGERGEKGQKGIPGKNGKTPAKGIDYFTNKDILFFRDIVLKEIKIPEPKNITIEKVITLEERQSIINETLSKIDFTLPLPNSEEIRDALQSLKGDKRLDASAIKNLPVPRSQSIIGGAGITRYAFSATLPLTYDNQTGIFSLNYASGLSLTNTNLTNDLITGKAGGQTIIGGINASDNLTLISTTNAIKGNIIIGASNQLVASATGVEVGSTTAATHPLTFPSASSGMAFYNTTDQTTNYERFVMNWNSNIFQIVQEFGGTTNSGRIFRIKQGSTSTINVDINSSASSPAGFVDILRSTSGTGTTHLSTRGTSTAASGITIGIGATHTINQSGTAGYTALLANITEAAVGTGVKKLIDLQIGSATKFNVTNKGFVGINATTGLAALTAQAPADFTGTGTVSNSAGGSAVTGVGTLFTQECAVGDSVTIGAQTVHITAISSDTAMTTEVITNANSGVAFTVKKAIVNFQTNAGTPKFIIDSSGNIGIGISSPSVAFQVAVQFTLIDNDIRLGTSTGTKIGTATSQKLSFWNKTPIVQPTTGITGAAFVQNSGTAVNSASTFGGYTLQQLAAILINTGLAA